MVKLFISLMTVNLRYIHDFQSENSFTTLNLEKPQPPRPTSFYSLAFPFAVEL